MTSNSSSYNDRAVDLRRNGFALSRGNSHSEHEDLSCYVSRGRAGYSARPRSGRQGNPGIRNGDMYGWGREGRIRLEPSVFLRGPEAPLNGYLGRQVGVDFNRGTCRGLHNGGGEQEDLESIHSSLFALPYYLAAHHPISPPCRQDIFIENGLFSPDPYNRGALEFPGNGEESQADSLGSVSEYSLHHLDRVGRPYHYQPPYVEDYVSELEEELLRQQDELDSLHDMMAPSELSGLLSPRGGYFVDPADGRETP